MHSSWENNFRLQLQIWLLNRMNEQNAIHSIEIENLKRDVAEIRKNMGFDDDLFDDLDDFDKKVSLTRLKACQINQP